MTLRKETKSHYKSDLLCKVWWENGDLTCSRVFKLNYDSPKAFLFVCMHKLTKNNKSSISSKCSSGSGKQ